MATKTQQLNFIRTVYPAALRLYRSKPAEAVHPLFVTAQAALETGWNSGSIPNNLFGITKGSSWTGATRLVLTTEYFKTADKKFTLPEKIVSVTPAGDRYKYSVYRLFRVYDRLEDCLFDHLKVLQSAGYKDAYPYRDNPREFARRISDAEGAKYATAPNYAATMSQVISTVEKLVKELEIQG